MKIAYIMQCHKNPKQINRLISKITGEHSDVFIHVDKKNYSIATDIIKSEYVKILPYEQCVNVKWGGYSQIEASWHLIESVLESGNKYDFIWLISGQDYPIASQIDIIKYLEDRKGYAFINIAENNLDGFNKRNEIFYPQRFISKKLFWRLCKKIWVSITGGAEHSFKVFKRNNTVGKWYFGSSWWCLPYECVQEIVSIIRLHPQKMAFFRNAVCCDESFFQTMVMQTSYKDCIEKNLVYVDWSNKGSSPRVLTIQDYDKFKGSGKIMARKFDINVDAEILNMIDDNL